MAISGPSVKIFYDDWADPDVTLPTYETAGAAGADIRANFAIDQRTTGLTLVQMQRALVPTGLRMEIPDGYEVQVRPRSGLALKHGISLVNAPGTIDSDYRGPIGILLINLGTQPFAVVHGDRIAQLIVAPVVRAQFDAVAALSDTGRGAHGFGSTGRR